MARRVGLAQERSRQVARPLDLVLQNAASYPDVRATPMRRWLAELVRALAPEAASLGVRLCGDRAMRELNHDFRGRDQVTDVLSFPGDASIEPGKDARRGGGRGRRSPCPGHLGDVVVCVPQARRQAAERGETLERELRTLLLHGVLHCLGHDHEQDDGEMDRLERKLRRRWLESA
jgi:probable rRNA maturation factor